MHKKNTEIAGRNFEITTDYMAKQANGSILAKYGETIVLATAVMGKSKEGLNYFPLMVDYEEKLYAAGKIKGSRFIKREGRASDQAILTARLIDRGIRPLFADDMRNEVQVILTVLSVDEVNPPDMVACNAASMALAASDIPWDGPLASVRIGKVEGEYVLNPTYEQMENSTLDLVVSSTSENIMMVEAGAKLVPEEDIVGAMRFAEKHIKEIVAFQNDLVKESGKEKAEVSKFEISYDIQDFVAAYEDKLSEALYGNSEKSAREQAISEVNEEMSQAVEEKFAENENAKAEAGEAFGKLMKKIIKKNILENEKRVDGRPLNQTRTVSSEVGLLPRTHGSALFMRGETQVLSTVTLGSPGEEQILDTMEDFEETTKRYLHHYNFPPFSVGEVGFMRGPGRREIGHGALAERALQPAIPPREEFPYTIRVVSEVLGSNGSTSMASTCGSTLSLMDAGVPIKHAIGGVAMGLVIDTDTGNFKVLTDIQGIEDGNGDMDFKVTGSENGISALQMDVKVQGVTVDILEQALQQAKEGRLHILSVMNKTISQPRSELSKYAPRIATMEIDPEKIGMVIGSGGKTINKITEETKTKIDIEEDGLIAVSGGPEADIERALAWIRDLTREIEVGEVYEGKVVKIMDFGAFVEVLPGKDGMVHISKLAKGRINKISDHLKVGDSLEVKVMEIDDQGRVNLVPTNPLEVDEQGDGDRNGGGGNRGGGNRGRDRNRRGSHFDKRK